MGSGSIRKLLIGGISFNVAGDANASMTPERTVEGIPHSGGNSFKEMRNPGQIEGLTVIASDAEYESLKTLSAQSSVTMSYTKADGTSWTAPGRINLDPYESEENRVDVTMIPAAGKWDRFS